jgi:Tfp pilus assembly protein PilO
MTDDKPNDDSDLHQVHEEQMDLTNRDLGKLLIWPAVIAVVVIVLIVVAIKHMS